MIFSKALKKTAPFALAWAATLTLGGCSGSDGSDDVEGYYAGILGNTSTAGFNLVILEDGSFWNLYGTNINGSLAISGFLQGNAVNDGEGNIASSNTRDFGSQPAQPTTLNASVTEVGDINGVIGGTGNLTLQGSRASSASYDYSTAASSATIAGNWVLSTNANQDATVAIAADGSLSGTDAAGCSYSGSIVPRSSGKNVFNVTLTYGAAPCAKPNQTFSGIALSEKNALGGGSLSVMAIDTTRLFGFLGVGTR